MITIIDNCCHGMGITCLFSKQQPGIEIYDIITMQLHLAITTTTTIKLPQPTWVVTFYTDIVITLIYQNFNLLSMNKRGSMVRMIRSPADKNAMAESWLTTWHKKKNKKGFNYQ